MLHKTLKPFPDYFLWGASTSAYQVEGASLEDGKGPSCQDVKELPAGTADLTVSVDHYHHYKEDLALFAEMGLKALRVSMLPRFQRESIPVTRATERRFSLIFPCDPPVKFYFYIYSDIRNISPYPAKKRHTKPP